MAELTKRVMGGVAVAVLLSAITGPGHAQDADDASLDVTIRLLPENAVGPEEITRQIELPPAAARRSDNAATPPADPANGLPPGAEQGRGSGLDVAAEARERGREFGQEVAEQARENRENAGRPDGAGPPLDPPATPGGPNGPPAAPPGRP